MFDFFGMTKEVTNGAMSYVLFTHQNANFVGPAIVEERETTAVIRPGWTATVADDGSIIAERAVPARTATTTATTGAST